MEHIGITFLLLLKFNLHSTVRIELICQDHFQFETNAQVIQTSETFIETSHPHYTYILFYTVSIAITQEAR